MTSLLRKPLSVVKRKIQFERTLKRLAFLVVILLAAFLGVATFLASQNFSSDAIFWTRLILAVTILILLWKLLVSPLIFKPSTQRIARFLEERYPSLQDRLSTAVEIDTSRDNIHPDLRRLIQQDAYRKLKDIPKPRFYWPGISSASLTALVVTILSFLVLYWAGPSEFGYSLSRLVGSGMDETVLPLYRIEVTPGNATVGERADVRIGAASIGFEASQASIFVRYENHPQWDSSRMYSDTEGNGFTFQLFDVRESIDYYVEADGIRSDNFRVEVSEIPRVESFKITLRFPSYTGMSDVVLEEEYSIRALKGTEVFIEAITDQPVNGGLLNFETADELELVSEGPKRLVGNFKIDSDDFFRVLLTNSTGMTQPGSGEFSIDALKDQSPTISFNFPGRDRKVTNIEEVFTELAVEDDYGITDILLRFSVNGGPEEEIELSYRRGTRKTVSSHTFYLEEFELIPGDFVSYYGEARDATSTEATDMFFLEVTPFEREYFQSQQSGNSGGMNKQGMQLSREQKQIVIATFSLTRDRDRFSSEERKENSQTLGLMQQRLGIQVKTIVERIQRRAAAASDSRFLRMSEYMEKALEVMALSEKALNEISPETALPEAQKALQQLLRAESLFNEMQVSFSESGASGNSTAEQLADLVDLELDRTKNQYETLQQNQQFQQEKQIDEALEKLKELARRQEQEVERQRQQARSGSKGGSQSTEQMMEEIEELARQLARLSREKQQQELNQVSRQLQRAARDMKNSLQSGNSGQQSMQAAQQAMEKLRKAAQELNQQRQNQVKEQFDSIKQQAQNLLNEQKDVMDGIRQMEEEFAGKQPDDKFYDKLRPLYWNKLDIQEDLQDLESSLHQFARRLQGEEPEASRKLKQAGLSIRDERLPEKMEEGSNLLASGLVNLARHREEGVEQDLRSLAQNIHSAENSLGTGQNESKEEKLKQALSETGELVDKLESLKEMVEAQQDSGDGSQESGDRSRESGGRETDRPGQEQTRGNQQGQEPGQQRGQGQGEGDGQGNNQGRQNPDQQSDSGEMPPRNGQAQGSQQMGSQLGGPGSGINPGQLGKEWEQRVREASDLSRLLRENPELARQASSLLGQMNNMDPKDILDDPEEAARLRSGIIAGLHQLELDIKRQIQAGDENYVHLTNDDEVPPEFRKQVAEYYRKLSQKKQ